MEVHFIKEYDRFVIYNIGGVETFSYLLKGL
jgi:hypothetical protein